LKEPPSGIEGTAVWRALSRVYRIRSQSGVQLRLLQVHQLDTRMITDTVDVEALCAISRDAGLAILEVYARDDLGVQQKSDDSPLTEADLAAHRIIVERLPALAPGIPILSEESGGITAEERMAWTTYWLVDPLDGTKEFINRNGEFTVNIALIDNGKPILGVVYVPVTGVYYLGDQRGAGEAVRISDGNRVPIRVRPASRQKMDIVASRRHGSEALEACLARLGREVSEVNTRSIGSSLKLCLVASGEADLYPRLAPTSEWDTAAAQAVVEAAGGTVVDESFAALQYNTKESLLNPFFYVIGDRSFDWKSILADGTNPT